MILIVGVLFFNSQKDVGPVLAETMKEPIATSASNPSAIALPAKNSDLEESPFKIEFQREVALSSRIDPDPERSERRLDLLAAKISSEDQRFLKKIVMDPEANGDHRAVAEEILGRSPSSESYLEEIAGRELADWKNSQRNDFERALSARAIEHLGHLPSAEAENSLRKLTQKLQDSFLVDRAHRALLARTGKVPSPEAQDQEALKVLTSRGQKTQH